MHHVAYQPGGLVLLVVLEDREVGHDVPYVAGHIAPGLRRARVGHGDRRHLRKIFMMLLKTSGRVDESSIHIKHYCMDRIRQWECGAMQRKSISPSLQKSTDNTPKRDRIKRARLAQSLQTHR